MFVRTAVVRLLNQSRSMIGTSEHGRALKLVYSNVICGVDRLTSAPTRCYSENSSKNNKSFPQTEISREKKSLAEDENVEMFNLEGERKKLQQATDLSKYDVFKDEDSQLILDVEEEKIFSRTARAVQPERNEFDGVSLERGVQGVFDVTELVSILKKQSAQEVVVIEMATDLGYADHMVIVSGKSTRHLRALADYVRRLFKKKMHPDDKIPIIEGRRNKSDEWLALDLGNIILHIFSKKTREVYDLESLWTLGPEYDPHLNAVEDPLDAIMSKHSTYLADLEPADNKSM